MKLLDSLCSLFVLWQLGFGHFYADSMGFLASIFLREHWYNWYGEMAVKSEFEKRIEEINETIFYRT